MFAVREASLLGEGIAGSPFRVYVSPGMPFAPHCVASGLGRRFSDVGPHSLFGYANQTMPVLVRTHDVFGNELDRGGAVFFVRVIFNGPYEHAGAAEHVPRVLTPSPEDFNDGSYGIEFTPEAKQLAEGAAVTRHVSASPAGDYTLHIQVAVPAPYAAYGFGAAASGSPGDASLAAYYTGSDGGVALTGGGGGGLKAEYFDNAFLLGPASVVRIDPTVDLALPPQAAAGYLATPLGFGFAAGSGGDTHASLLPLGTNGDLSVRWSGLLRAPSSGNFTLSLDVNLPLSAEGASGRVTARLFLDDGLLALANAVATQHVPSASFLSDMAQGNTAFEVGVLYRVRVEFEARSGGMLHRLDGASPRCRLLWQNSYTPRQAIPAFFFYPSATDISGSPFPIKVLGS